MAKKKTTVPQTRSKTSSDTTLNETLGAYAETLGGAMGNLRNHIDTWKGQRAGLVKQLSTLVADAQSLLADLGHTAAEQVQKVRRGRKPKRVARPNPAGALKTTKKRQMSPEGREAIAAAQKKRWAKVRRTQNKG